MREREPERPGGLTGPGCLTAVMILVVMVLVLNGAKHFRGWVTLFFTLSVIFALIYVQQWHQRENQRRLALLRGEKKSSRPNDWAHDLHPLDQSSTHSTKGDPMRDEEPTPIPGAKGAGCMTAIMILLVMLLVIQGPGHFAGWRPLMICLFVFLILAVLVRVFHIRPLPPPGRRAQADDRSSGPDWAHRHHPLDRSSTHPLKGNPMREPQTEREREMVRQARKMIGVGALILGAVGAGLIYQGIRSDNALLIITPIVVVLPMIFLLIRTQQPPGVRGERRHPSWVEPVHTHPGEEPPPPPDTLPTVVNLHQSQCLTLLTDFTDNRCTEEELHRGLTELQREYRDALNRFSRQQITQYGGTEPHRDPIQLLAKCFTMLLRRQPSELTEEIVDWHIDALKRGEMDEELFQSE